MTALLGRVKDILLWKKINNQQHDPVEQPIMPPGENTLMASLDWEMKQ